MPRKKPRNPLAGKGRTGENGSDDDSNDNASVFSYASDVSNDHGNPNNAHGSGDENNDDKLTSDEVFEEKLREAMDMATQKSANGRVNALKGLQKAFAKRLVSDFVDDRRMTLTDVVEKALKKGKADEVAGATGLAGYLCVQLAGSDSSEEVYATLKPVLVAGMSDNAANPKARAAMANALGTICFLACNDLNEFPIVMETLEKIFRVSYNTANVGKLTEETLALHTAALNSWSLMLTMLPASKGMKLLQSHAENLGHLLESGDVDLRIAAGEALVVLYEIAYDFDEDEAFKLVEDLLEPIKNLATDSHKYRSKKDRKEQKSSFRDILKYIEDDDVYYEKVSVSQNREQLEIESWSTKRQYDTLCKTLATGMDFHLAENEFVRQIFGMGAPLPSLSEVGRSQGMSKQERQSANQQAFKWRTQTRGKHRDKRSAIVH